MNTRMAELWHICGSLQVFEYAHGVVVSQNVLLSLYALFEGSEDVKTHHKPIVLSMPWIIRTCSSGDEFWNRETEQYDGVYTRTWTQM